MEDIKFTLEKSVETMQQKLIRDLTEKSGTDATWTVSAEMGFWADRMKVKYPKTYDKTRSWHAALNSTPDTGQNAQDFPGEDSIFACLHDLQERLINDKNV